MSALSREFDKKEQTEQVVTEDLSLIETKNTTQIKKRSPQEQVAWESDLAVLLQKQRQAYDLAITKAFAHTQPSGHLNLDYIGSVSKMRTFLHEKYGVSVTAEGNVNFKLTGTPEQKVYAVYLGLLEVQQQSAVPSISAKGGTPEEHITLLKALLIADCSIPLERLWAIIPGIYDYVRNMPKEIKDEVEALITLSKLSSILNDNQQEAKKPLNQAERRAELVKAVHKWGNAESVSLKEYEGVLLKMLASNDAQIKVLEDSRVPKPAERSPAWTQTAASQSAPFRVSEVNEPEVKQVRTNQ